MIVKRDEVSRDRPYPTSEAGVTLIELLVAVSIMGIS